MCVGEIEKWERELVEPSIFMVGNISIGRTRLRRDGDTDIYTDSCSRYKVIP